MAGSFNDTWGPTACSEDSYGLDMFGDPNFEGNITGSILPVNSSKQLVQSFLDEVLRRILVHYVYNLHIAVFPFYLGKCIKPTTVGEINI